jgi:gentisate 1,2-dioxygenase
VSTQSIETTSPNAIQAQRNAYYQEIANQRMEALWNALSSVAQKEPRVESVPFIWKWKDVRKQVLRAGDLVTPQEAERRVLMLINPAYTPRSLRTVGYIYAGLQLILPGERADTHRHTPAAQRFIIEGEDAYTTVNGERTYMKKGDYVTTPNWCWHDHGNESSQPMIWLDGLDIPFVNALDANFFEEYKGEFQPVTKPSEDSRHRWGQNLQPAWEHPARTHSPILNYRWEVARKALHDLRADAGSPFDGIILEYTNPLTGGSTLPTMSAYLQLLRRNERTKAHQHTSSTIYHVAEGGGFSIIGEQKFEWEEGDTFVVPSWMPHFHASLNGEAVLFSYTDRPVLSTFNLYRERSREEIH